MHRLAQAAAVVAALMAAGANAAPQVDQSQLQFNLGVPFALDFGTFVLVNSNIGQSYTAGMNGQLQSISVFCNGPCALDPQGSSLSMSLYQGPTLLSTATLTTTNGQFDVALQLDYLRFDFSGSPVA